MMKPKEVISGCTAEEILGREGITFNCYREVSEWLQVKAKGTRIIL